MQIQMAERELLLKKNTVSMKPTLWSAFCAIIILASSAPAQAPQLSPVQAELAGGPGAAQYPGEAGQADENKAP